MTCPYRETKWKHGDELVVCTNLSHVMCLKLCKPDRDCNAVIGKMQGGATEDEAIQAVLGDEE